VLSGSELPQTNEIWLKEVEALLDRQQFCDAETVLPTLEARAGSELEQAPLYLLLRGRARYLCDRYDEARIDYERAWELSKRETEIGAWVCVRLGQLLFHDEVDDAMRWAALGREEVAGLQHTDRLLGEFAVLEGRILRTKGLVDKAEALLLEAEQYFSGVRCWHRALQALHFRLEVDAVRDQPDDDQRDDDQPVLAPDQLRIFMTKAKQWDIEPAEWVPRVVEEATRGSIRQLQPGVERLLVEIDEEYGALIPTDEHFWVGRALMCCGENDLARTHLVLASNASSQDPAEGWKAEILLAVLDREADPDRAKKAVQKILASGRQNDFDGSDLIWVSKELLDWGFLDESKSLSTGLVGREGESKEIIETARLNLAGTLLALGDTRKARELLAAVDWESIEHDHEAVAVAFLNRGVAASTLGSWEEALEFSRKSIEMLRRVGDSSQLGSALVFAAESANMVGQLDLAVQLQEELDLLEWRLHQNLRARIHLTRGGLLQDLGCFEEAVEEYEVGLSFGQALGDEPLRTSALISLSYLLCDLGAWEDVDSLALSALRSTQRVTHLRGRARFFRGLAGVALNDNGKAERHFRRAARDFRQSGLLSLEADCWNWVAFLKPVPIDRVRYARRAVRISSAALCFINERDNRLAMRVRMRPFGARLVDSLFASQDPAGALAAACEVKASEFLGLLRGTRKETESIDPALLLAMTAATENGTTFAENTAPGSVALRHLALHENGAPPNAIETFHAFTGPRTPVADAKVKPRCILRRLKRDEAAVEYFLTDPLDGHVLIFVSHRGRVRCHRRRWRVRHADALRMLPNVVQGLSHGGDVGLLQRWLRILHDVLVKPLGNLPERVTRLWLAPGGLLERVPFEALLDAHGRTLLERVETTRLLTTAQLALLPKRRPVVKQALVLRGSDGHQIQLHHAEAECLEVRTLTQSAGVSLTDQVDKETLTTVNLLHYAGHASFEPGSPDAGTIFLAGRRITARDLIDMPLKARPTVVLSACESGRTETGTDEFGGFLRAFFAAGATDIVCSGWLADDATTRDTMRLFYEGFLGQRQRPAEALRAASLEVRKNRPHPFHWANFRCYGLG